MTARRYIKYYLPAAGFVGMLLTIFYRMEPEYIVYSVLGEIVLFLLGDPYNVIHFWLSFPARLILISCIVVDTYVIRAHWSVSFVAIPLCISVVAVVVVIRYNTDWRARRAYIESETVQQAMQLEVESAAAISWQFHGRRECLEMAYRLERYTGKPVFNPVDAEIWQEEQRRLAEHLPPKSLKNAIDADRIIDFMGFCYKLGYNRSAPQRAYYEQSREEIQVLEAEVERLENALEQEQERAARGWAYAEEQRDLAHRALDEGHGRFDDLQKAQDKYNELLQYTEGLEDELERIRAAAVPDQEVLEGSQAVIPVEIPEVPAADPEDQEVIEAADPEPVKAVRRLSKKDKEEILRLRNVEKLQYKEIVQLTGISESTVKRIVKQQKEA